MTQLTKIDQLKVAHLESVNVTARLREEMSRQELPPNYTPIWQDSTSLRRNRPGSVDPDDRGLNSDEMYLVYHDTNKCSL